MKTFCSLDYVIMSWLTMFFGRGHLDSADSESNTFKTHKPGRSYVFFLRYHAQFIYAYRNLRLCCFACLFTLRWNRSDVASLSSAFIFRSLQHLGVLWLDLCLRACLYVCDLYFIKCSHVHNHMCRRAGKHSTTVLSKHAHTPVYIHLISVHYLSTHPAVFFSVGT